MGNTCLQCCVVPKGVIVTDGPPQNPFAGKDGWPTTNFQGTETVQLDSEDDARMGLDKFAKAMKMLKIFNPSHDRPTICYLEGGYTEVKQDMLIAVSIFLGGKYLTSLERVGVVEHIQGDSFLLVIHGHRQNIIDGYYRIRAVRTGKSVKITFSKVQVLVGEIMRLIAGKEDYYTKNQIYAEETTKYMATHIFASSKEIKDTKPFSRRKTRSFEQEMTLRQTLDTRRSKI